MGIFFTVEEDIDMDTFGLTLADAFNPLFMSVLFGKLFIFDKTSSGTEIILK